MFSKDNPLRVFVSHKLRDRDEAKRLAVALGAFGNEKVRSTGSFEFPLGDDWATRIRAELSRTHIFVLLLKDSSGGHDWILYEAGFFSKDLLGDKRLIVIHDTTIPVPAPLRIYNSMEATTENAEKLLRQIYDSPSETTNRDGQAVRPEFFTPEHKGALDLYKNDIVVAAARVDIPSQPIYFSTGMRIRIAEATVHPDPSLDELSLKPRSELGPRFTVDGHGPWERVFGKPQVGSFQWDALVKDCDHTEIWQPVLFSMIRDAAAFDGGDTSRLIFRPSHSAPAYRPTLHKVERTPGVGITCEFLLNEIPYSKDEYDSEDPFIQLHNLLVTAYYFRVRIFERYSRTLERQTNGWRAATFQGEALKTLRQLQIDLRCVYSLSTAVGIANSFDVTKLFTDLKAKQTLERRMIQEWPSHSNALLQIDPSADGAVASVQQIIKELGRINAAFYSFVVKRYEKVLLDRLVHDEK